MQYLFAELFALACRVLQALGYTTCFYTVLYPRAKQQGGEFSCIGLGTALVG